MQNEDDVIFSRVVGTDCHQTEGRCEFSGLDVESSDMQKVDEFVD
jgi:hypothetical protein